nr:glycosyltransferase [Lewinella sp. JB7]
MDLIDKLYVISQDGYDYLQSHYQIRETKVSVSRLGVYSTNNTTQRSSDGVYRIVSVSGVTKMKRVEMIADYLVKLATTNAKQKFAWTHLGAGPLLDTVKDCLKGLNSSNLRVELKGHVTNAEVYDYYRHHPVDVFLNLSESEGLPVSIMEAQANGVPVIAPDVGGVSEIVNETTGVLLSEKVTYAEFENAFWKICTSESSYSSASIQEYWRANFDAAVNYMKFAHEVQSFCQDE